MQEIVVDVYIFVFKFVVIIFEDFQLDMYEKFVFEKGLNYIFIRKCCDEYMVKVDCEKFFWCFCFKVYFSMNQEFSEIDILQIFDLLEDIIFEFFKLKIFNWILVFGRFGFVDYYIFKCWSEVNKFNFKCYFVIDNLILGERVVFILL